MCMSVSIYTSCCQMLPSGAFMGDEGVIGAAVCFLVFGFFD